MWTKYDHPHKIRCVAQRSKYFLYRFKIQVRAEYSLCFMWLSVKVYSSDLFQKSTAL